MPGFWSHPIGHLTGFLAHWAAIIPVWAVLAGMVLAGIIEATPFLGILVPAHTLVFLVSFHWATVGRDPLVLLAACTLGGALGDSLFYGFGRRYGLRFMERWPRWVRIGPERRAALESLFASHGFKTILLARSQPVTRSFAPYVAGASQVRVARFLPPTLLGSLLVSAGVVASGYLAGLGFQTLGKAVGETLVVAVVALVLILLAYVWLTHHLKVLSRTTLSLALVAVGGLGVAAWLTRRILHGRAVREVELWPAALARLPEWLGLAAAPFQWLGDVHVLLLAFLAFMAWHAWRGQWRNAYTTLFAGPGLFGVLLLLRWQIPRVAPSGLPPRFPMTGSFPNESAALAVVLAGLAAWTWLRGEGWRLRVARMACGTLAIAIGLAPLASGSAWPFDAFVGAAMGLGWLALCLLGDTFAQRLGETASPATPTIRWLQGSWQAARAWLDRWVLGRTAPLWALVALGVALRLAGPWGWAIGPDANRYAAMAHEFQRTGTFLMPWGDFYTPGTGPQPSHHFPPFYPTVLAGAFQLFGFNLTTLRAASIALSLGAVAVTYACTRNLYGHYRGVLATAVVAVSPMLVVATNKAYSENLLLLLFVPTLWAILKAIDRPWYMVPAALLAALGYLTKSSMGAFFLIAGLGGLAWRLHWRGWRVLRDPAYVTAIFLFGATVVAWGWRNWRLFGSWETSSHLTEAYLHALAHPVDWTLLLVFSFLFVFILGYLVFLAVLPWLPALARTPRLRSEHDSGLWLAIGLPLALAVLIDAALWLLEREFFIHNVRYVSFAVVPLVWLLVRNAPTPPAKIPWGPAFLSFGMLLAGSVFFSLPHANLEDRLAEALGPRLQDGDSITYVGTPDVYRGYFHLTDNGRRTLDVRVAAPEDAGRLDSDWLLWRGPGDAPPGYAKALHMAEGEGALRSEYTVWQRVASRIVS